MENSKFSLKEFDELRHLIKETVLEAVELNTDPAIKKYVNGDIRRLTVEIGNMREEIKSLRGELSSVKKTVENSYEWKVELLWLKNLSSWVRKTGSYGWILIKAVIPTGTAVGLLYALWKFIIKP